MSHGSKKDTMFMDIDLKALLLKSISLNWQNSYLLKGTHTSDDFCKMLSYFVQLQSIIETQTISRSGAISQNTENRNQHKYICTSCGQSGCFHSSFQNSQNNIECTPCILITINQAPFVDFQGPCPVHPMPSHL